MSVRTVCLLSLLAVIGCSSNVAWAADSKPKAATKASAAAASKAATKESAAAASKPAADKSETSTGLPKVLDFSAVWCAPCKKFSPLFDKVSEKYKGKVDFVHYDAETGPGKPLADKYKVNILPTVIFMDAKGKIVLKNENAMTEEDLIKKTDALLK